VRTQLEGGAKRRRGPDQQKKRDGRGVCEGWASERWSGAWGYEDDGFLTMARESGFSNETARIVL